MKIKRSLHLRCQCRFWDSNFAHWWHVVPQLQHSSPSFCQCVLIPGNAMNFNKIQQGLQQAKLYLKSFIDVFYHQIQNGIQGYTTRALLYRAGVGFELAIKRSPAGHLDHSATTSLFLRSVSTLRFPTLMNSISSTSWGAWHSISSTLWFAELYLIHFLGCYHPLLGVRPGWYHCYYHKIPPPSPAAAVTVLSQLLQWSRLHILTLDSWVWCVIYVQDAKIDKFYKYA